MLYSNTVTQDIEKCTYWQDIVVNMCSTDVAATALEYNSNVGLLEKSIIHEFVLLRPRPCMRACH